MTSLPFYSIYHTHTCTLAMLGLVNNLRHAAFTAVPEALISLSDQRLFIGKNMCLCVCVCIHTHTQTAHRLYMNYRWYQITVKWNVLHISGAVRSVDWIFIIGTLVCVWLGQYVTLDRTSYSLILKQEAVAATVGATFCYLSHYPRRPLFEIQ